MPSAFLRAQPFKVGLVVPTAFSRAQPVVFCLCLGSVLCRLHSLRALVRLAPNRILQANRNIGSSRSYNRRCDPFGILDGASRSAEVCDQRVGGVCRMHSSNVLAATNRGKTFQEFPILRLRQGPAHLQQWSSLALNGIGLDRRSPWSQPNLRQ